MLTDNVEGAMPGPKRVWSGEIPVFRRYLYDWCDICGCMTRIDAIVYQEKYLPWKRGENDIRMCQYCWAKVGDVDR